MVHAPTDQARGSPSIAGLVQESRRALLAVYLRYPPPELGAHTANGRRALGYTVADIAALHTPGEPDA